MNNRTMIAGIDAGHVYTKAVLMKGADILGCGSEPTGFDPLVAAQAAVDHALAAARASRDEMAGIISTGIFRDAIKTAPLNVISTVPGYVAAAKGGWFLNKDSRTVIEIGGNIHQAVSYDSKGDLLDVIQNDKCADGLGIFHMSMAKALGIREQEMSELALRSTRHVSIAIQCALSAESEAIDLMCRGADLADISDAIVRFIAERVASMCNTIALPKAIAAAGGLARSQALIKHLEALISQEVSVLSMPEYVGAIGAVVGQTNMVHP